MAFRTWEIPAELKAPGSGKKGIEKAVRDLLSFVILVVTPLEAEAR